MEKVELRTADIAAENAAKLAELFPDIVTEVLDEDGNVRHSIDVEALKAHVGDIAEDKRERYQFTWPGKQKARAEAIRPIDKTMRPCVDESVNWDTTENLYIEGDNLDALKILRETYAGKIKMIYIDPPYNTGHDFVYNDTFAHSAEEERAESGAFDEEGNVLDAAYKVNNESNGKFHSDWCSMMYPRLVLARDLLSEDGVLYLSIDDNELTNLKAMCDTVFGGSCHTATFLWAKTSTPGSLSNKSRKTVEYVLLYERRADSKRLYGSDLDNADNPLLKKSNPLKRIIFPRHSIHFLFKSSGVVSAGSYENGNLLYDVTICDGLNDDPVCFECHSTWTQDKVEKEILSGTFFIAKTEKLALRFQRKESTGYKTPNNLLNSMPVISGKQGVGTNESVSAELESLGIGGIMSYPKPESLIRFLVNSVCKFDRDAVILDFFSGSATTAHAVMQLNAEDGGNRKFIMVQLPEVCDEKSEAAKAGYQTICEIGKERIRRAGAKIAAEVEESNAQLKLGEEPRRVPDIGFRVLKIDSSNFEDVSCTPDTLLQDALFSLADNVKPGRTPEDILFQLLPQFQIPYTASVEKLDICGKTVYSVDGDALLVCFDREVSEDVIRAMAEREPSRAVLRDASFVGDDALANFEEIFKTLSPETETRVV